MAAPQLSLIRVADPAAVALPMAVADPAVAASPAAAVAGVGKGNASGTEMSMQICPKIFAVGALAVALTMTGAAHAQQRFSTPEEAVTALVAAIRTDDAREMVRILGEGGREIVISGDEVADQKTRAAFLLAYEAQHQIQKRGTDTAELLIGRNDWPLPIPLVQKNGSWQFDTARGREEILYRRIGRNELAAIQVVLAYVDAQNDYAAMNPTGGKVDSYAQQFVSTPGRKDGLYWSSSANEPRSPLGELAVLATAEGYRLGEGRTPYHGYYYRILKAQGASAPGGAVDYLVNGDMIGGFALVAYPAEYGNSGIMTFIVNNAGVVYQRDLGPKTARIAASMTTFNPDHTWRKVPAQDLTN